MKVVSIITILIVNYNTADFIINTLYCLEKITKNNYKVVIADNNSKIKDYKKLENYCRNLNNVELYRKENFSLKGSLAHGTSLNELVKKVDTPYFSILDADASWLKKNWDEILIDKLNDKIKVIGTQASGDKPLDFPLMFAIFFEMKTFKNLNIDFRPKDLDKNQDTGHELREKYLNAGFEGKNIEMKNTRDYKEGLFKEIKGAGEFYLAGDYKNIFASHFGRGSNLGIHKYRNGATKFIFKIPLIGRSLIKLKGKKDRSKWIKICKKTVDNQ